MGYTDRLNNLKLIKEEVQCIGNASVLILHLINNTTYINRTLLNTMHRFNSMCGILLVSRYSIYLSAGR